MATPDGKIRKRKTWHNLNLVHVVRYCSTFCCNDLQYWFNGSIIYNLRLHSGAMVDNKCPVTNPSNSTFDRFINVIRMEIMIV